MIPILLRRGVELLVAVTAISVLSACSSVRHEFEPVPGHGVDKEVAETWSCDWEYVQKQIEQYKLTGYMVPGEGASMCDVLAQLGLPDDIDRVSEGGEESAVLWYQTAEAPDYGTTFERDQHMIRVRWHSDQKEWLITKVVW